MWEQIRANKRKSAVLIVAMALLLVVFGAVMGEALAPGGGWMLGLMAATALWFVMTMVSYFQGGKILMAASGARRIQKKDHPQLFNIVEEMQIAAGMKSMPAVYIIDDLSPNAFATGRDPDHAAVAVTKGLLAKLNRDQLQGVIAHEMSHIVNRDVLFMTLIGVMLGAIVMVSQVALRGMFYGGGRVRRSRSSSRGGGGQAQAIMMVLALLMAILAPILARIIYFAASRRREYLADANAAALTRYPEGLAQALEIIGGDARPMARANQAIAPMYIHNPMQLAASSAFSTHPPIAERVRILRGLTSGASLADYEQSWRRVAGESADTLPASALAGAAAVPLREAHADSARTPDAKARLRQVGDALRMLDGFLFIPCACGLRLKLPPDFTGHTVECPRCHRRHSVDEARQAQA
ncbi:MAG: M48 family metallopeptidase [Candidatus Hydrogenedentes bacterium]|nr:M48 family metallopeptidase [Candidatus Hydrogenedentota bacterium]